jgi:hypothetical protein
MLVRMSIVCFYEAFSSSMALRKSSRWCWVLVCQGGIHGFLLLVTAAEVRTIDMSPVSASIWRLEAGSSHEEPTIVPSFQCLMEFDAKFGKSRGMCKWWIRQLRSQSKVSLGEGASTAKIV